MNWSALEKFSKPLWVMVLLALVVGVGGGIGSAVFHWLILGASFSFYGLQVGESFLGTVTALPWYMRIALPTLGGLMVGLILTPKAVRAAYGEGVPEVMEAIILERGKIVPLVAPLKALISAISIGSGGAGGREGPVIQIGSAIGSTIGQFAKLPTADTRLLLAAGAAAGIGGTFGAPLAGVVFAAEILLRRLSALSFIIIALAAVTGQFVAMEVFGVHRPLLAPTELATSLSISAWSLLAVFTLIAVGVALLFSYILRGTEWGFRKLPLPFWSKPALGGLLLGIIALWIPQVHELGGYAVMQTVMTSPLPWLVVLTFMFAKMIATSLTIGSGGAGGVFAPSLFIGSMAGTVFGTVVLTLMPNIGVHPAFFALIGMGAVFAGATHAPVTAIIILLEMTESYELAMPLTFACLVSAWISRHIKEGSIYTAPLLDEGINPATPR